MAMETSSEGSGAEGGLSQPDRPAHGIPGQVEPPGSSEKCRMGLAGTVKDRGICSARVAEMSEPRARYFVQVAEIVASRGKCRTAALEPFASYRRIRTTVAEVSARSEPICRWLWKIVNPCAKSRLPLAENSQAGVLSCRGLATGAKGRRTIVPRSLEMLARRR